MEHCHVFVRVLHMLRSASLCLISLNWSSSFSLAPIHSVLCGAGSNFDDNDGSRGARRPIRKERDDKVHDSIIEERIQRERPCRTLFIRNIKASLTSSSFLRRLGYIYILSSTIRHKLISTCSMKPTVMMCDASSRNMARSKPFSTLSRLGEWFS